MCYHYLNNNKITYHHLELGYYEMRSNYCNILIPNLELS